MQKEQKNFPWLALLILCLGDMMIVLDTTVVNVALPSIKADLGFSQTGLVWVINAYLLTFGGFLLLSGRMGDLFGHRALFMIGIGAFAVASLVCGIATSATMLIVARAAQGIAGAIVTAMALSLMMILFTEEKERAKAMGIFGFVAAGGGSIGVVLGGVITSTLSWKWIFLINIPIAIAVLIGAYYAVKESDKSIEHQKLDYLGAILITSSLMLVTYAIVQGNEVGWKSLQTIGLIAIACMLFIGFIYSQKKRAQPLVDLTIFKNTVIVGANIVAVLWAGAMFAWFFLSAIYMQVILHFTPLEIGLTFLPGNIIMAIFSIWLSAKMVMRYGTRIPLVLGMSFIGLGLLALGFAPLENGIWIVMVSMVFLGLGSGMAFNPLLLAAMGSVTPEKSGLASGLVNTSFMMGGALGLAILASLAQLFSNMVSARDDMNAVLLFGYHGAFFVAALFAFFSCFVAFKYLKVPHQKISDRVH